MAAALEALRSGSFSRAAETLGVSHAAISRRVAGAESWAGVRLFERHGRGVRPTPEGQRLLTRLQQHFDEIDTLVDRSHRPRVRETVRLAVTPSFARFWLLPRLSELEAEDLRIEVLGSPRHTDLAGGEADLAIRYGRGGWGMGLETMLCEEVLVPVGGRIFDLSSSVMGEEILNLPLLHNADTFLWRSWARRQGLRFRNKGGDRVFVDYSQAVDAAYTGLGLVLWNHGLHPLPPGMTALEHLALPRPPLCYYLLCPEGRITATAARLADRLLAAIRQ